MYDIRFYKAEDEDIPGEEENAFLLKDVPERYFSEVVMQLDSLTEDD